MEEEQYAGEMEHIHDWEYVIKQTLYEGWPIKSFEDVGSPDAPWVVATIDSREENWQDVDSTEGVRIQCRYCHHPMSESEWHEVEWN